MRIAEKTIELNFCAQVNALLHKRLIWFGLTQRQEAQAGFDACSRLGARLLVFQFKASNFTVAPKTRRFYASHDQMQKLQARCRSYVRSIFYVFPLIGTTVELTTKPDLLSDTWLLDVSVLPRPMPRPTKTNGKLRKNRVHYVDVTPGRATIHSEPFTRDLIGAKPFFQEGLPGSDGAAQAFGGEFDDFWKARGLFGRSAVGAAVFD